MELLVLNEELFPSSSPHFPVCLQKYSGLHLKEKTVCAGTKPTYSREIPYFQPFLLQRKA